MNMVKMYITVEGFEVPQNLINATKVMLRYVKTQNDLSKNL
jgi:hypothetical protein